MLLKFIPKEYDFFSLFEAQANFCVDAAREFKRIVSEPGIIGEEAYKKIQDLEHKGDNSSHHVIDQLNKTFITPFDREDIHALTKELDNIIDMINTMVARMKMYKIPGGNKNLIEFANVIEESVVAVAAAVKGMSVKNGANNVFRLCVEVNRLENVGDSMRDTVIADLFEKSKDAIEIIKWKEVYQDAETVLDVCEDVAHVVESILVKQG
jgi:uncharacterized protein Yka (UPF0111/DUF47 family)